MSVRTRVNRSGSVRHVADTYDAYGRKEVTSHLTRREALDAQDERRAAARAVRAAGGGGTAAMDRNARFGAVAEAFLDAARAKGLRPSTIRSYRQIINTHLAPVLRDRKVREIGEEIVSKLLSDLLKAGKRRATVSGIYVCAAQIMQVAVRQKLLPTNPLRGLGKTLNLGRKKARGPFAGPSRLPKAMRQEQLATFLGATLEWRTNPAPKQGRGGGTTYAAEHLADPAHDVPVFAVMAWAGLRLGEAIHLRPADVDLARGVLHVRTADDYDEDDTAAGEWQPKTDASVRDVDLADNLRAVLEPLLATRRAGRWLLYPEMGADTAVERKSVENHVQHVMNKVTEYGGFKRHFSPHSLRHSFAMALLETPGVSMAYVSQQLGHASIKITVDIYGSSWALRAPGAVTAMASATTPAGFLDAIRRVGGGSSPDALRATDVAAAAVVAPTSRTANYDAPRGHTPPYAPTAALDGNNA